jgi:hypothetical protein
MMNPTNDLQGVGLYAEFRKPNATLQIFITPDGYDEAGSIVTAHAYRRTVTPWSPKKQWRSSSLRITHRMGEVRGYGGELSAYELEKIASKRLAPLSSLFENLIKQGWSVEKEPFFIECSKKDLTDVRMAKTPAKLMYRINQTRKAMGFPESLIPETL